MTKIAAALLVLASTAYAEGDKHGRLVMLGHDAARITYEDHCSNGSNITKVGRDEFLKAMLADPKSKLSALKARAREGSR